MRRSRTTSDSKSSPSELTSWQQHSARAEGGNGEVGTQMWLVKAHKCAASMPSASDRSDAYRAELT
jgi:hypothetical protein